MFKIKMQQIIIVIDILSKYHNSFIIIASFTSPIKYFVNL